MGLLWLTCFIAGCAFSDSMGITTKRQTGTELVKVPVDADNDGVQDKDPKTGEPLFEIVEKPIFERDWSDTTKFVGKSLSGAFPAIGGAFTSLVLGAGTIWMKMRANRKEENLEAISAAGMKIINKILAELPSIIADIHNNDTATRLEDLPKLIWKVVKERATEYKSMLSDPSEWDRILRELEQILTRRKGKVA